MGTLAHVDPSQTLSENKSQFWTHFSSIPYYQFRPFFFCKIRSNYQFQTLNIRSKIENTPIWGLKYPDFRCRLRGTSKKPHVHKRQLAKCTTSLQIWCFQVFSWPHTPNPWGHVELVQKTWVLGSGNWVGLRSAKWRGVRPPFGNLGRWNFPGHLPTGQRRRANAGGSLSTVRSSSDEV